MTMHNFVLKLVLMSALLVSVYGDCQPVEENSDAAITCRFDSDATRDCEFPILRWNWNVERESALCNCFRGDCECNVQPDSLIATLSSSESGFTSTMTIPSLSRSSWDQDFSYREPWTCSYCRSDVIACEDLQIYIRPERPTCRWVRSLGSTETLTSIALTCTTTRIFPRGLCYFYEQEERIDGGMVYNQDPVGDVSVDGYYRTTCSRNISVDFSASETLNFHVLMYPDVTGGEQYGLNSPETSLNLIPATNPSCTLQENDSNGILVSVTFTCATSRIFPWARCQFHRIMGDNDQSSILDENIVYSHDLASGNSFFSSCSMTIRIGQWGSGTFYFYARMFPNVAGGERFGVDTTPASIELSLPTARINYPSNTEYCGDYIKGTSIILTCTVGEPGKPRALRARWFDADDNEVFDQGPASESSYLFSVNEPRPVCKAVSALGESKSEVFRGEFAQGAPSSISLNGARIVGKQRYTVTAGVNMALSCDANDEISAQNPTPKCGRSDSGFRDMTPGSISREMDETTCTCGGVQTIGCDGEESAELTWNVLYQPSVILTDGKRGGVSTVTVNKGEDVEWVCTSVANPYPHVTLERHDRRRNTTLRKLQGNRKSMTLRHTLSSVKCEHTGVYACQSWNLVGQTEAWMALYVNCPLSRIVSTDISASSIVIVPRDGDAVLSLRLMGYPDPTAYILKKGFASESYDRQRRRYIGERDFNSLPDATVAYEHTALRDGESPYVDVRIKIFNVTDRNDGRHTLAISNGMGWNKGYLYLEFTLNEVVTAPSTEQYDSERGGNDIDTTIIVAIIICAVVVALAIVGAIACTVIKKGRTYPKKSKETSQDTNANAANTDGQHIKDGASNKSFTPLDEC